MNPFWGMIIYEITGNGTLAGLWKNNGIPNGIVVNEIARKNDNNPNEIEGTYTVAWIEETNDAEIGTLVIRRIENNMALAFEWTNSTNTQVFLGVGMPIGLDRIAVTYWDTNASVTLNCL